MSFNPDPSKQAQEIIFTCKVKKVVHSPIFFNNRPVQHVSSQKHLDLILDAFLMIEKRKTIVSKFSKTIGLLPKLNIRLPRFSLSLQIINHL